MMRAPRKQTGASLIEVVVAMVVVAFGLLGVAALQARSLSLQVDSESRRVATGLVSQLRERVSSNHQGYAQSLATGYTKTLQPGESVEIPGCADANACDAATEVPAVQIGRWLAEVRRQLPEAAVDVAPTTAGSLMSMTVTVGWLEPNATVVAGDDACARIPAIQADPNYRCITTTFFPG
jgi:type IV pilus assembly protein PilV